MKGCVHIITILFGSSLFYCSSLLFLIEVFQDIVEKTKVILKTVGENIISFTFYPCFLGNIHSLGMSEMPIKTMCPKHVANFI